MEFNFNVAWLLLLMLLWLLGLRVCGKYFQTRTLPATKNHNNFIVNFRETIIICNNVVFRYVVTDNTFSFYFGFNSFFLRFVLLLRCYGDGHDTLYFIEIYRSSSRKSIHFNRFDGVTKIKKMRKKE